MFHSFNNYKSIVKFYCHKYY